MDSSTPPQRPFGRGRGRASISSTTSNNQLAKTSLVKKYMPLNDSPPVVDHFKRIEDALRLCLADAKQANMNTLLQEYENCVKNVQNDECVASIVKTFLEQSFETRVNACSSGSVASTIISSPKFGGSFRTHFLKKIHQMYQERNEIKEKDFNYYIEFTFFMTSVFKYVLINKEVIKILIKPIYTILGELLDSKTQNVFEREQEVLAFRDNLLNVAVVLQCASRDEMDELFKTVRCALIRETEPKISCILLQIFELYCYGDWSEMGEINSLYRKLGF